MMRIGDDEQKINYEWPNVISFKKLCIYFSLVLAHFLCHFMYISLFMLFYLHILYIHFAYILHHKIPSNLVKIKLGQDVKFIQS